MKTKGSKMKKCWAEASRAFWRPRGNGIIFSCLRLSKTLYPGATPYLPFVPDGRSTSQFVLKLPINTHKEKKCQKNAENTINLLIYLNHMPLLILSVVRHGWVPSARNAMVTPYKIFSSHTKCMKMWENVSTSWCHPARKKGSKCPTFNILWIPSKQLKNSIQLSNPYEHLGEAFTK